MSHSVTDDHAISAGSSLTVAGHALLDEPSAKIGVDETKFGSPNSFKQTRESDHAFRLENSHTGRQHHEL